LERGGFGRKGKAEGGHRKGKPRRAGAEQSRRELGNGLKEDGRKMLPRLMRAWGGK